jgi:alkanesulfonate monooxygenase SsuD/methylene tetrahydromethanopterin reductase-like flavin-dependent oxidoreductase (luciferase family)
MKFGLHYQVPCSASQSPVQRYRDTLDQATYAEVLGFESVWPVEQHFIPDLSIMPAPMLLLAALAERTKTLRLGIAIVLLPLSHPLRIAEEAATLDVLSNGRVEFGIGRGSVPSHFLGFGIPQAESRERFLEGLEVIRRAWTDDRVSYRGRFFNVDNLTVVPKPVQQPYPPIRVAANSVDTFELMGRLGLPIFAASQVNPFARIREFLPIYREHRKAAGHPDIGDDDVTVLMPFYVGESAAKIRCDLEPSVQHLLHTATMLFSSTGPAPLPGNRPFSKAREKFGRLTYDKFAELMGVLDTPDACVERLGRLREDFGMGRVILWFNPGGRVPHDRVMRSMELFAAKVMPHFA